MRFATVAVTMMLSLVTMIACGPTVSETALPVEKEPVIYRTEINLSRIGGVGEGPMWSSISHWWEGNHTSTCTTSSEDDGVQITMIETWIDGTLEIELRFAKVEDGKEPVPLPQAGKIQSIVLPSMAGHFDVNVEGRVYRVEMDTQPVSRFP